MICSNKKSWANSINDSRKSNDKYNSVKLPVYVLQSIPGQLKSPPNKRVYKDFFILIGEHNKPNHPKPTQETGVDSKKNQESYCSVYGCGSAPKQLHKMSQS